MLSIYQTLQALADLPYTGQILLTRPVIRASAFRGDWTWHKSESSEYIVKFDSSNPVSQQALQEIFSTSTTFDEKSSYTYYGELE
jgi:hypothetical protein